VLITAVDVLIVLAFFSSTKGRQGMLFFEILIVSLVRIRLFSLYLAQPGEEDVQLTGRCWPSS